MGNPFRQESFTGGELSPSLYGRTALKQYQEGCRTLRNCIVTPRGSVVNRPGTTYIAQAKSTGVNLAPRLIPFIFDDGDTYVLEFGHLYVRFYKNGSQIVSGGNPVEVVTPYDGHDVQFLKYAQVGDVLYLTCPAGVVAGYTPQTLTRNSDTSWALSALSFDVGQPAYLGTFGAGAWIQGPLAIGPTTAVPDGAPAPPTGAVVPSASQNSQEWQWAITEIAYDASGNVWETAPLILTQMQTLTKSGATPWDVATTYALNAKVYVDYTGGWYVSLQNGNTGKNPATQPTWWQSFGTTPPPSAQASIPIPICLEDTEQINAPAWDGTATYSTGQFVSLDSSGKWWVATGAVTAGKNPIAYGNNNSGGHTAVWDGPHGPAYISWNQYNGLVQAGWNYLGWKVYRGQHGTFGYLGTTTQPYFKDYGATPDYSQPPPQGRNPFKVYAFNTQPIPGSQAAGSPIRTETPQVVTVFQQRLVLADTPQRPGWFWASQVNNPVNFDSHLPGNDADEYEFQLSSQRMEQIRGALGLDALFFTSESGLWVATGDGGPITRSNIDVRCQSTVGASWNDPIAIGDIGLYIRRLGLGVNEVVFDWRVSKWRANDVSSLSRHLFDGNSLYDWTYAREPYSVIWATRSDGQLLSLTYHTPESPMNEEPLPPVKAWSWHDTGPQITAAPVVGAPVSLPNGQTRQTRDAFGTVCAVHEDGGVYLSSLGISYPPEDAVYCVVRRTINGFAVFYVERFFTRQVSVPSPGQSPSWPSVFLDCAVVMSHPTVNPVPGMSQLVGESVMALADGNVIGPYTVSNAGTIDISDRYPDFNAPVPVRPAQLVVGLPYYSDLGLLDAASQQASIRTNRKTVTAVVFEIAYSRGIYAGEDFNNLKPWAQRQVSDSFLAVALKTGHARVPISGSWNYGGRAVLRQVDPLPLEVLAFDREMSMGSSP